MALGCGLALAGGGALGLWRERLRRSPAETAWQGLARRGRRPGRLLGVDPSRYPRDFAVFARFHQAVEALGPVHEPPPPMRPERFEELLRRHATPQGIEVAEDGALSLNAAG